MVRAEEVFEVPCLGLVDRSSSIHALDDRSNVTEHQSVHQRYRHTNTSHMCTLHHVTHRVVTWRSGNAFRSINEVTVRRAGLVLRWVTACRQVNHLGM